MLIPAFAVDRTEVVLFRLRELIEAGEMPVGAGLRRLADGAATPCAPTARRSHAGAADIDPSLAAVPDPFDPGQLVEIRDVEESKALARNDYPSIIVSASGMATGGRVLHHLARLLPDRRNAVILPGLPGGGHPRAPAGRRGRPR